MKKFKDKTKIEKIDTILGLFTSAFVIMTIGFGFNVVGEWFKDDIQPSSTYMDTIKARLNDLTVLKPIEGIDKNVLVMIRKAINKTESDLNIDIVESSDSQVSKNGNIIYGVSRSNMKVDIKVNFSNGKSSYIKTILVIIPKKTVAPTITKKSVSIYDYGATGDGITDSTTIFQKAVDYMSSVGGGAINVPKGIYIINPDVSINMKDGVQLNLSDNAVLKASASSKENSEVINIVDAKNVNIVGGKIIGDRAIHIGKSGEWGMGINVHNSSNVNITDIEIVDCWGDGIYLGGKSPAVNVNINGVISDNNRRQGLSITNAKNINISNSEFKNTNGTLPQAGVDIEPNQNQSVSNVKIDNIKSINNKGSGIDMYGIHGPINQIQVLNSTLRHNDGIGIMMSSVSDVVLTNNIVTGSVFGVEIRNDIRNLTLTDMTISNNQSRGVSLVSSKQKVGIENVVFENATISNNSQNKVNENDGVRIDTYDSTGYIKNVKFMNTKFIDNQTSHTQGFGLTVGDSKLISDIKIYNDCVFSGNISGDLYSAIPISQNVPR